MTEMVDHDSFGFWSMLQATIDCLLIERFLLFFFILSSHYHNFALKIFDLKQLTSIG